MDRALQEEHQEFEDEARRIARELWPAAEFSGAAKVDGRERDGVFETEECLHLLEATTSRSKAKAEDDIRKLVSLAGKLRARAGPRAVRCWFITRDEPLADQRKVAEKHRELVNVLSLSQFQSRLVNVNAYLAARESCSFGSVRDPATGHGEPKVDYISLQFLDRSGGTSKSPNELGELLASGGRFVLLGDYGAGKSMTMRFLFRELSAKYRSRQSTHFPVYINLREHIGQVDPSEVLERHARTIGFSTPAHLVRAWRAGYVHLLLDGFDEITNVSIQGLWKKLRDNRFRAMEAVRRLVRDHPKNCGLAVSGRAHFFDSDVERRRALGLGASCSEYSPLEFSDEQIREYFASSGFSGVVPQWLPSRPLLVAYLASRGLLSEIAADAAAKIDGLEPAEGWRYLLERISAREAEIEAGIDGDTVRRILERLATKARAFQGGLGPLTGRVVVEAFQEICGYAPDERGMLLLQRLPGLGIDKGEEETRSFIDEDFVDACRTGDAVEFIRNPYAADAAVTGSIECGLGPLALSMLGLEFEKKLLSEGNLRAAFKRARVVGTSYLLADLVKCALENRLDIDENVYIRDVHLAELDLPAGLGDLSRVEFQDCYFARLGIDTEADGTHVPSFRSCYFGVLEGRLSYSDLPNGRFEHCEVEEFAENAGTTNAVLALDLPIGVRVLLTVLKKLYERRGSGRRENALFRGLDHRSRRLVPEILDLLHKEKLAMSCKRGADTIWLPDRTNRGRVGRLIATPSISRDPIVTAARALA